jgi:hypothetical protein
MTRAIESTTGLVFAAKAVRTFVHDDEREATATVTNVGPTVAQAVSPALTGYVMQAVSLSAPFVLGGVLKIVYDLLLYQTCRRVVPVSAPERAG